MELTLTTGEVRQLPLIHSTTLIAVHSQIISLLGATRNAQHLTNHHALVEGLLPLLHIQHSQLCIPSLHPPTPLHPIPPACYPELSDLERQLLAETLAKH